MRVEKRRGNQQKNKAHASPVSRKQAQEKKFSKKYLVKKSKKDYKEVDLQNGRGDLGKNNEENSKGAQKLERLESEQQRPFPLGTKKKIRGGTFILQSGKGILKKKGQARWVPGKMYRVCERTPSKGMKKTI